MAEWTVSQWFVIPLIFAAGAFEAVGMLGMFLYILYTFVFGQRVSVSELKSNTPKLPR